MGFLPMTLHGRDARATDELSFSGIPDEPEYLSVRDMLTIANFITLIRIFLIPIFVVCMLEVPDDANYRYISLAIFVLMALTDIVDGYLARKLKETSTVGRYIDPLADKLLVDASCILLAQLWWKPMPLPKMVAVVVISRDVFLIFGVALFFFITGRFMSVEPTLVGKLTTFCQIAMVAAMLVGGPPIPEPLLWGLWALAVALSVASGVDYLSSGIRQIIAPATRNEKMEESKAR